MIKLSELLNSIFENEGPCWDGYEQIGMKEKNGKQVPNCVPIKEVEKSKMSSNKLSPEQSAEIDLDDDGKITKKDFKILRKMK